MCRYRFLIHIVDESIHKQVIIRHSKTFSKDFDMTRSKFDCREHSSHGLKLINAYFSFCIKSTGHS